MAQIQISIRANNGSSVTAETQIAEPSGPLDLHDTLRSIMELATKQADTPE